MTAILLRSMVMATAAISTAPKTMFSSENVDADKGHADAHDRDDQRADSGAARRRRARR